MSILDQLRNWAPTDNEGRTDFDDDVKRPYRSRVPREMIRTVKGATDLRDAMPARPQIPSAFAGTTDYANQKTDSRPYADEVGQPSERQRALIVKLVNELMTLDERKGADAAAYTLKMTQHAAWERNRKVNGKWVHGNTSRWIDTLLTVLKSLRSNPTAGTAVASTPSKPAFDAYDDVTDGNYAIVRDGKTRFYRITRRQGKGQYAGRTFTNIQERVSEALFPVRGQWPVRKAILDSIRTAGVVASHLLYSERLTRCWHCNILLTDDDNPYKPHGLGPVCGPKVMGPL